ncbi:WAP four-disulfide core domain 12, partial [Mus musculus]
HQHQPRHQHQHQPRHQHQHQPQSQPHSNMWPNSILVLMTLLISSTLVTGGGVKGEEKRVCPPDYVRCIRQDDPQCYSDNDCGDQEICCFWQCGFKCVLPVKDNSEEQIPQSKV